MTLELLTVQVVGFKNSGKTTLICHLIESTKKLNLNVATIKHHGHGGKPDVNKTQTAIVINKRVR